MNIAIPVIPHVAPTIARFIRLGHKGAWARFCIESGEIRFGSPDEPHERCLAGDWDGARTALIGEGGRSPSEASQCLREIREFYTLPAAECLWITFFEGRLWWTFAEADVRAVADGGPGIVMRGCRGGWRDVSRRGLPLVETSLSTRLTQVRAYQRTICNVAEFDYLVRKINDTEEPSVLRARAAREEAIVSGEALIAGLHWAEFEVLADLLLTRSGWHRVSALGKSQPDVDLVIEQPATGERGFVQVKSKATQATLEASIAAYRTSGAFSRMFFVCHSPTGHLRPDAPDVHILTGSDLARRCVDAGLLKWLIARAG
ncbi:restriction endonuclease [Methylobacterium brachythecii]|uniref:Restriction endonuclease type IV Mrr domain-containing protein n=1 Tax=Methylobacterium brachythecii TaxID=1176177 RepID=A0A7W6AI10_9HYPH|nr:restriction endonuclease [Methylobacterium brachythecii]MBB3902726.1 hypothetical protein [Methylobacterium brachythecii]GLS42570.1 hypothetical protein GCM10007884_05550 [Methylobacterium brachythecii]